MKTITMTIRIQVKDLSQTEINKAKAKMLDAGAKTVEFEYAVTDAENDEAGEKAQAELIRFYGMNPVHHFMSLSGAGY